MACNNCESQFQSVQSLAVSIQKSGTTARLWLQNQGRNILYIRRILLCYGGTTLYLRPPGQQIAWTYPSDTLEQGTGALFYQVNNLPAGTLVQAQAEFIEIDGRSRSCPETM
jgi:hypothetical protein